MTPLGNAFDVKLGRTARIIILAVEGAMAGGALAPAANLTITTLRFGSTTHLDMRPDRYTAWDRPPIALAARATHAKVPF